VFSPGGVLFVVGAPRLGSIGKVGTRISFTWVPNDGAVVPRVDRDDGGC
jgi:hypothetical protein